MNISFECTIYLLCKACGLYHMVVINILFTIAKLTTFGQYNGK